MQNVWGQFQNFQALSTLLVGVCKFFLCRSIFQLRSMRHCFNTLLLMLSYSQLVLHWIGLSSFNSSFHYLSVSPEITLIHVLLLILIHRALAQVTCTVNGKTPLHVACKDGHVDVLRILLERTRPKARVEAQVIGPQVHLSISLFM